MQLLNLYMITGLIEYGCTRVKHCSEMEVPPNKLIQKFSQAIELCIYFWGLRFVYFLIICNTMNVFFHVLFVF